jgi:UDP-3-O-[3-hydroxymyristoyl] glucosamine N-acyltransferase
MKHSLRELADVVRARVLGHASVAVSGVSSIERAGEQDVVFVESERQLEAALASRAGAVIAGRFAADRPVLKPMLIAEQPRLAFARAAEFLYSNSDSVGGAHPTAVIDRTARIDADVIVEEGAVIRADAEVGAASRIGAGCVIEEGVKIGAHCRIYPNVTIYSGTRLGDRVIVHAGAVLGGDGFGFVRDAETGKYQKFPQLGRLEISDDVEIGCNSTIDRGALEVTRIGAGTKIDNLVHIGHNVQIGRDVVIAAQTGISGSAVIEDGVIIAGQVGIADHVRIEAGAILGAQSGVPSKKVIRGKGVVFWGTPARPIGEYLKGLAALAKLTRKS